MRRILLIGLATGALAGIGAGCDTGFPAGREPHHELNFLDMADQPKLKPQRSRPWRPEPPLGAIATDYHPYLYAADQGDLAGLRLRNPLARDEATLAHGAFVFDNVCIVCHGKEAAGDGEVTRLFPKPPSLMTARVRDWPDGRIFHVPMRGQASMPSYAKQLPQSDLWAAVLHIRALQARLPVAPPDPTRTPTDSSAAMADAGVDADGGTNDGGANDGGDGGDGGNHAGGGGSAGADQPAGSGGGPAGAPASNEAAPASATSTSETAASAAPAKAPEESQP